jgi:hypothetical protein
MGYVPYVGFTTYRRATVLTRLYFKRLMLMQMFWFIKKKKKKTGRHTFIIIFFFFFFFFFFAVLYIYIFNIFVFFFIKEWRVSHFYWAWRGNQIDYINIERKLTSRSEFLFSLTIGTSKFEKLFLFLNFVNHFLSLSCSSFSNHWTAAKHCWK